MKDCCSSFIGNFNYKWKFKAWETKMFTQINAFQIFNFEKKVENRYRFGVP